MNNGSDNRVFTLAIAAIAVAVTTGAHAASRINPGTIEWAQAARGGRADMLMLGDSIVSYGTGGWSSGFAAAAKNGSIGLAGSALLAAPYDLPYVWAPYTGARAWTGPFTESLEEGLPSLTPSGRHYDVQSQFAFVGTGFDEVKLDLTQPFDLHVFAAGRTPSAQLQGLRYRRTLEPSAEVIQVTDIQSIGPTLSDHVFSYGATNNPGDWSSFEFGQASRDTSLYYTKLLQPNATGITVTGWSYSGGDTQSFRDEYYNHPRFTAAGRDAFYHALTEGNSGKLNVAITFGVNDALRVSETAYQASIAGLIADVRRDWQAAGLDASDLSFTLISAYQVNPAGYAADAYQKLNDFRAILDSFAAADPRISFVDIWGTGPTSQQAVANGYLADPVHPTAAGTRVYGKLLADELLPEQGDADVDGDVDFDDLLALAQHYGRADGVSWYDGDFDGLEGVAFDDLLALSQNYGMNALVSNASFEADWALARTLVPEPASLGLASMGCLLLARRRR